MSPSLRAGPLLLLVVAAVAVASSHGETPLLQLLPELLPAAPGCGPAQLAAADAGSPLRQFLEHVCHVQRAADRLVREAPSLPTMPPRHLPQTLSLDMADEEAERLGDELPEGAYTLAGWMAPMQSYVPTKLCRQHSRAYLEQINKAAGWALQMFDSSGKMPDGMFYGNLNLLGSWDGCLSVKVQLNETEYPNITESSFTGQYVLAQFIDPSGLIMDANTDSSEDGLGFVPILPFTTSVGGGSSRIRYGYCVPSSCSLLDVTISLNGWMRLWNATSLVVYGSDAHVADEPTQLANNDIAVIAVLAVFGAVIALCTALDVIGVFVEARELTLDSSDNAVAFAPAHWRLVTAFSLRQNGRKLFSTKTGADNMGCIHGMRFLSMTWVLLGHNYLFALFGGAWVNTAHISDIVKAPAIEVISNALLSVDTFFLLGGLMVSYGFMKTAAARGGRVRWFDIPLMYLHRYLRLTPVYAMVIAVTATIMRRIGTGPGLDSGLQPTAEACQDKWWRNLLYINNFGSMAAGSCMGQSWYLPVDFQLFIVSPFMLLPWIYNKKLGAAWLGLITLGSVAAPAAVTYTENLPPTLIFFNPNAGIQKFFPDFYEKPWCRASVYICGLWLGLLLHHIKANKITVRIPLVVNVLIWGVMSAVALTVVYGTHQWNKDPNSTWTMAEAVSYASLHRLAWGVALSWVIFACITGYGGFADMVLSFKGFIPLGRLTYTTYLVAVQVQTWYFASFKLATSYDNTTMVLTFFSNLAVSIALAVVFSLCFEAPMMTIVKMILPQGKRKTAPMKQTTLQTQETPHEQVTKF